MIFFILAGATCISQIEGRAELVSLTKLMQLGLIFTRMGGVQVIFGHLVKINTNIIPGTSKGVINDTSLMNSNAKMIKIQTQN